MVGVHRVVGSGDLGWCGSRGGAALGVRGLEVVWGWDLEAWGLGSWSLGLRGSRDSGGGDKV